ncbi:MAG: ATP-binding cassette domain-containing protein, partial [Candidatus Korarchaeota archaeon]
MSIPLKVEGLVKKYGELTALHGISFEVNNKEVFGLIGVNGAGKSTTLRIVATLLKPTSGKVEVYGYDVVRYRDKVRELISYLPEEAGTYKNLTGKEFLEFIASVKIPHQERK